MIIRLKEDTEFPRLVFVYDVHERDIAPHGYRGDVAVEFADGDVFSLFFFDPTSVREILEDKIKWASGACVGEPGLVIIPEISVANMKAAVSELIEVGYFNHLKPIAATAANKSLNPTPTSPAK